MTAAYDTVVAAFWRGTARALGGAIIFSLPLFMTMEMWELGATLSPLRLATAVLLVLPLLVLCARYLGFRDTDNLRFTDHVADALVAYAVGALASAGVLTLLGIVEVGDAPASVAGMIAVQSVPASFGAAIARSQVSTRSADRDLELRLGYPSEVLLMGVGAIVVAFNIAPTEEVVLLAITMSTWHTFAAIVLSLVLMHAFVYAVGFRGQHRSETTQWAAFLGFTAVGYATALLVSAGLLSLFGRLDGVPLAVGVAMVVVLGIPAALGAAAARLIL